MARLTTRGSARFAIFSTAALCGGILPPPTRAGHLSFKDSAVGVRHQIGAGGRHDLPEIMGGGVALIDGDGDGRLDLFLCNGNGGPAGCGYFRNNGDGTFTDTTASAHAPGPSLAMGAAVGDFDGDGRDDLFVTGWRDQRLYRNLGEGRFEDVTARAGLTSKRWSTSAAWADLDGDGDLDLYVAGYLAFDPDAAPFCAAPDGKRDYCGPENFPAEPDALYRNNGDGTFTDVSRPAVIDLPEGRGLGVLIADLTGDARPDVFVANDGTACWLFENLGGLRFREVGAKRGVAFDGQGNALAGMGVALGDIDGDGHSDLVVSNFHRRHTVAFQSLGLGMFADHSAQFQLPIATGHVLGFGLALADFDGDGALDMIQANGHVQDRVRLGTPFAMRPTLLVNDSGRLKPPPDDPAPWFSKPILGRGLAVGDLDNDGRLDVVVNALDAPATILWNTAPGRSASIELVGRNRRTPFGAKLRATVAGRVLTRDLAGGGSYLSASDRRLFIGTGQAERIDLLEVTWPWGQTESWRDLPAIGKVRVVEGTGTPLLSR
jgi:enediyne biosynthesis protein E4